MVKTNQPECRCHGTKVGRSESLVSCPNCRKLQTTSGKKEFECCRSRHSIKRNLHAHEGSKLSIFLNVNLISITGAKVNYYGLKL